MPHLFHHDGEAHGIHLSALAAGKGLHDDMFGAVDDDLRGLHLAHPLVVQDAVLGTQDPQLAGAEGLAGVAELCQLCQHGAQALFVGIPPEESPVEGVPVALHGDLVAVVQAGHTRQGVDDGVGHPQAEQALLVGIAGHTAAALPRAAPAIGGLVSDHGQGTLGVVGGEEVQGGVHGRGRVVLADGQDLRHGLLGGLALDEIQHGVLEGVVHHAVQALAQQIGAALIEAELGGGILPHLAQQELFGADPLDGGAHLLNEFVGQLIGYIQPEACRATPQPGVDDTARAGDELHIGGGLLVDLGQGLKAPPAAVAVLVLGAEIVPAAVRGVGVPVRAALAIAALAVEVAAVGAGVAEHAVQHDADAVLLGGGAQCLKILVGAQQGVHIQVVGGVVAVVGVGLKDGVEVDEIHPHLVQVRELLLDALEVAAEIILIQVAAHLVGLPEGLGVLVGLIDAVGKGHGLVLHAFAEAVREDLIEHLALDAFGGLKVLLIDRDLPAFAILPADHAAVVGAAHDAAEVGVEVEVVEVEARVIQRHFHRKVVLPGGLAVEVHPVVDGNIELTLFFQDKVRVYIAQLLGDAERQPDSLPGAHRTKGLLEIGVKTVEQTRQVGSFLSQKKPRFRNGSGAEIYLC